MSNTDKIKCIERQQYGRYMHGQHFTKGDYIMPIVTFLVSVVKGASFEVDRDALLKHDPGRTRITRSYLDSFIGKDPKILK